ncbi:MAG: hypothetical protein K2X53_01845 [Alphaproteobacteria bacterium]|nr:hypothetical protein [Alphaproteobacteria bacterium]
MIYRFLMSALLMTTFQGTVDAGRFDLYYDIKDEGREAKAIVTSADGKILQERILKYGLNSFEDVPIYTFEGIAPQHSLKSSVLFVEFHNISDSIDSTIYWINDGSLGTIDEYEVFFDPPHLFPVRDHVQVLNEVLTQ